MRWAKSSAPKARRVPPRARSPGHRILQAANPGRSRPPCGHHLARNHVGLPRPGSAAARGLPGPGRHLQRAGRGAVFRLQHRACALRQLRRGVPRHAGQREFGVVPVENSTEGVVTRSLDLLLHTPLHVVGETSLLVRHNLLRSPTRWTASKVVLAHPQALAQCQGWLATHLPNAERRPCPAMPKGARLAATNPAWAGIASERAASEFGLHIVAHAIQDDAFNRTRFAVICLPQTLAMPQATGKRLHQPDRVGAQQARRGARHAGAAQEARRVHDALRIAPRPLRPVGVLLLHRHAGPSLAAPCGAALAGPAIACAPSTRCWAPTRWDAHCNKQDV
jgi:hypothetical protein